MQNSLMESANQGIAEAQNRVGELYYYGEGGVKQDYSQAMKWYLKAANQGNALAQINIGDLYYLGQGVKQDYSQAMEWYSKAKNEGRLEKLRQKIYRLGFATIMAVYSAKTLFQQKSRSRQRLTDVSIHCFKRRV